MQRDSWQRTDATTLAVLTVKDPSWTKGAKRSERAKAQRAPKPRSRVPPAPAAACVARAPRGMPVEIGISLNHQNCVKLKLVWLVRLDNGKAVMREMLPDMDSDVLFESFGMPDQLLATYRPGPRR